MILLSLPLDDDLGSGSIADFEPVTTMASTSYIPAPLSVATDFDAQSTAYTASIGSPSYGSPPLRSPSLGTGFKETAPSSVTGPPASPAHPGGHGSTSPTQRDDQQAEEKLRRGWLRLAQVLAETPCCESFPRFRELNVKNLVYFQVELAVLQSRLHKIELDDKQNKRPRVDYARNAESMLFVSPEDAADPETTRQRETVYEIRRLLKEYSRP